MREMPTVAFTLWLVIEVIPPLRHLPAFLLAIILALLGVPLEIALIAFVVLAVGYSVQHAIGEVRRLLANLRALEAWDRAYGPKKGG